MDGIHWVRSMVETLQVPRLGDYGLGAEDLESIAGRALSASSMKANPVPLRTDTLVEVLTRAL